MVDDAERHLDHDDRIRKLEDKLKDTEAWDFQTSIVALERRLTELERQIVISRITALELHAVRAIHGHAHAPKLPHGLMTNVEAAQNRVQAYIIGAIRQAETSDSPGEALTNLYDRVNSALKQYGFPTLEFLLD